MPDPSEAPHAASDLSPDEDSRIDLAIVLTGGGARGAYQVGVLRGLARHLPELRFPIITGASAGAINAIYLASHPGTLREATEDLGRVWEGIEFSDVFRIDTWVLARNALLWMLRLGLGLRGRWGSKIQGLLDTTPLRELLRRELGCHGEIPGIARNLEAGKLDAVALMTVKYSTGQTFSWVQGRDIAGWQRPARRGVETRLSVEHVMASAALPLMFPAIELDGGWFGDGGIRMAAPLSPALHLGADRILAISTQYPRSQAEADRPSSTIYPAPAQIAGNLLNAIFLDVLDQDVQRLERLNSLLRKLPPEEREGMKPVDILMIRPSTDLGKLSAQYEPRLPKSFRFMTRNLGTRETDSPDSLSLLMFQGDYMHRLIEVGERDAESRLDDIRALIRSEAAAGS